MLSISIRTGWMPPYQRALGTKGDKSNFHRAAAAPKSAR
jgi:hypothetical protein